MRLLFLLFLATGFSEKLTAESLFPKFPEIPIVSMVSEPDFRNSSTFIPTKPIVIQCTASYPVYFDFIPPMNSVYRTYSTLNSSNFNETLLIWFPSTTSTTTPFGIKYGRSGNYTCRSGLDRNIARSLYLHVQDNIDNLFDDTRVVSYSESLEDKFWIVPCPAHVPRFDTISLHMLKKANVTEMSDKYIDMNITNYDAQRGFLLDKLSYSRPEGIFKCVGKLANINDNMTMTLKTYNALPVGAKVIYENNNTFQVTCEADEEIAFVFTRNTTFNRITKIPSFSESFKYSLTYLIEENANLTQAETILTSSYSAKYLTGGKISCVTVNSSKVLHVWEHDISNMCKCTGQISSSSPANILAVSQLITGEKSYSDYKPKFPSCTTNGYYSSSRTVGYIETDSKFKTFMAQKYYSKVPVSELQSYLLYYPSYDSPKPPSYNTHLISCRSAEGYNTLIKAVATTSNYDINIVEENSANMLKVYIRKDDINYIVDDLVDITCVASRYSFYNGSMLWNLNFKNGSSFTLQQTAFEENNTNIEENIPRKSSLIGIPSQWSIAEGVRIRLNENLQSISCSATKWNSTQIETANYTLDKYPKMQGSLGYLSGGSILRCNKTSTKPTTVIARASYLLNDDLLSTLSRHIVDESNVTIPYGFTPFKLHCLAEYPTEWTFQGSKLLFGSTLIRVDTVNNSTAENDGGNYEPCFSSTLTVKYYDTTGNYTCRKRNDYSSATSVYIYNNPPNSTGRLIAAGEHITVTINKDEEKTVLPCRASLPEVIVDLYYHDSHGLYRKLGSRDIISYDPRIGFTMETAKLNNTAVYICSLPKETSPQMSVTISTEFSSPSNYNTISSKMLSGMDHLQLMLNDISSQSGVVQIQIIVLLLTLCLVGMVSWVILQQRRHMAEKARQLGSYIQLNHSL